MIEGFIREKRLNQSGRQDLNLRPLRPERETAFCNPLLGKVLQPLAYCHIYTYVDTVYSAMTAYDRKKIKLHQFLHQFL